MVTLTVSVPMGKEAWVQTSTKLKLWVFWWAATEGLGDLCLCVCFTGSIMPFCLNISSAVEDICLSNLRSEQTQDFVSSGISLIHCLLCQMLNKLESLMCWHALWALPKFSVFKALILQFKHCSGSARLHQFWAVKLWSLEQEGCQSQWRLSLKSLGWHEENEVV